MGVRSATGPYTPYDVYWVAYVTVDLHHKQERLLEHIES